MNHRHVFWACLATLAMLSCAARSTRMTIHPPDGSAAEGYGSVCLFRPDTPSIVGIAEVPFVYLDEVLIGRLDKGCLMRIPLSPGNHSIRLRASFLTAVPSYTLGELALEIKESEELYVLFSANIDQAHKLGPYPPATLFMPVDRLKFLKFEAGLKPCP